MNVQYTSLEAAKQPIAVPALSAELFFFVMISAIRHRMLHLNISGMLTLTR